MLIFLFTAQVEHEFISYVHDGSETTADNFTLVANDTDIRKQSMPHVIHVNVTPVNDEAPVVTINRILRVRPTPLTHSDIIHIIQFQELLLGSLCYFGTNILYVLILFMLLTKFLCLA